MIQARRPRFWLGMVAGAAVLVLAGFFLYGPTGRDDVYKTLWPARTLADSGRILNYNGDALEQSSSLLHVLVLGGVHRISGMDLPDLNLALVLCFGGGCLWMAGLLGRKLGIRDGLSWGICLGGQAVFVYWAMGGLDSVVAAFCWLGFVLAAVAFLEKGSWTHGLWMLVACAAVVMVRPEGVVIGIGGLVGMIGITYVRRIGKAEAGKAGPASEHGYAGILMILGMLLAAAIAVVGWRVWHSGNWMPQPVVAKAGGFGLAKALDGLRYVWRETRLHPELAALWLGLAWAGWDFVRKRKGSAAMGLVLSIALAGLGFVVLSGGDWMENGRFLVPFIPLLVLVLAVQLEGLPRRAGRWLKVAWIAACVIGLVLTARYNGTGYSPVLMEANAYWPKDGPLPFTERYNRVHLRDIGPLEALKAAVRDVNASGKTPATVLSQQAGMMPYHLAEEASGRFRFMDLVGLCTADFTDCSVTKSRGNYQGGLNMDLIYFFDDLGRLQAECGIAAPDIVFGLDDEHGTLRKHVLQHGYRLVYLQEGMMPMGSGWFPGLELEATEFIVVRDR